MNLGYKAILIIFIHYYIYFTTIYNNWKEKTDKNHHGCDIWSSQHGPMSTACAELQSLNALIEILIYYKGLR